MKSKLQKFDLDSQCLEFQTHTFDKHLTFRQQLENRKNAKFQELRIFDLKSEKFFKKILEKN